MRNTFPLVLAVRNLSGCCLSSSCKFVLIAVNSTILGIVRVYLCKNSKSFFFFFTFGALSMCIFLCLCASVSFNSQRFQAESVTSVWGTRLVCVTHTHGLELTLHTFRTPSSSLAVNQWLFPSRLVLKTCPSLQNPAVKSRFRLRFGP